MLDIFQFSAIYAVTADINILIEDKAMQAECARYVASSSTLDNEGIMPIRLINLYTSLRQGHTLKNWCIEHREELQGVDVRRFVTFGVIKGFLYRVQKFAIAVAPPLINTDLGASSGKGNSGDSSGASGSKAGSKTELPLAKFLDGTHCFDEICTELQISERDVLSKLKGYGDVQIVHR